MPKRAPMLVLLVLLGACAMTADATGARFARLTAREGVVYVLRAGGALEVFGGRRYRVDVRPDGTDPAPNRERQGRFREGTVDLDAVRSAVREEWGRLEILERVFPALPEDLTPGASGQSARPAAPGSAPWPSSARPGGFPRTRSSPPDRRRSRF